MQLAISKLQGIMLQAVVLVYSLLKELLKRYNISNYSRDIEGIAAFKVYIFFSSIIPLDIYYPIPFNFYLGVTCLDFLSTSRAKVLETGLIIKNKVSRG